MRNIVKKASLILFASACFSVIPAYCQQASSDKLEKALMKYILSYEAYQSAKCSNDNAVRAKLPKYIRLYRESYSQYLELLRESDLYNPTYEPENVNAGESSEKKYEFGPADIYNKEKIANGENPKDWQIISFSSQSKIIKNLVNRGRSVEDVSKEIENQVASTKYSSETQVTNVKNLSVPVTSSGPQTPGRVTPPGQSGNTPGQNGVTPPGQSGNNPGQNGVTSGQSGNNPDPNGSTTPTESTVTNPSENFMGQESRSFGR